LEACRSASLGLAQFCDAMYLTEAVQSGRCARARSTRSATVRHRRERVALHRCATVGGHGQARFDALACHRLGKQPCCQVLAVPRRRCGERELVAEMGVRIRVALRSAQARASNCSGASRIPRDVLLPMRERCAGYVTNPDATEFDFDARPVFRLGTGACYPCRDLQHGSLGRQSSARAPAHNAVLSSGGIHGGTSPRICGSVRNAGSFARNERARCDGHSAFSRDRSLWRVW
jgi:hypothetical protein